MHFYFTQSSPCQWKRNRRLWWCFHRKAGFITTLELGKSWLHNEVSTLLFIRTEVTASLRNRYCTTKMCCRTLPSKISNYFNEHTVISAVQSSVGKQKKERRKRQNFQRLSITKGTKTPIITGLKLALTRECPEVQFHRLAALKILYSPSSQKLLMESCIYITEVQKGPLHTHWAIFSFIVHILFITTVNTFIVFHLSVILK